MPRAKQFPLINRAFNFLSRLPASLTLNVPETDATQPSRLQLLWDSSRTHRPVIVSLQTKVAKITFRCYNCPPLTDRKLAGMVALVTARVQLPRRART